VLSSMGRLPGLQDNLLGYPSSFLLYYAGFAVQAESCPPTITLLPQHGVMAGKHLPSEVLVPTACRCDHTASSCKGVPNPH
jgi:hypothetical protein